MPNAVPSTMAVAGIVMLLLAVPTLAAPAEPLDAARDRALAWLIRGQQADGSWRKLDSVAVQSTALVLDAFARFGVKGVAADRGVSWLANAPADNHDALSRSLGTLGERGLNVSRPLAELMQGADSTAIGWGIYPQYRASSPDTGLVLLAVQRSKVTLPKLAEGLALLVGAQQADGGWGYGPLDKVWAGSGLEAATGSDVLPTAVNVMALSTAKAKHPQPTSLANGINWLSAQQLASGGFGAPNGTVLETALAAQALAAEKGPADGSVQKAQAFLLSKQQADGSWGGDPLLTASALQSWPAKLLLDTDKDGVPDSVEAILNTSSTVAERPASVDNGRAVLGVNVQLGYERYLTRDKPFTDTLPTRGIEQVNRWSLLDGNLPLGLTLDAANGQISGTPTQVGRYPFRYQLSNAAGDVKTVPAVLTVTRGVDRKLLQLILMLED
ncbi:prenyltransferase/squalene oxidase repeat-containing protein [Chitinivorax sp. B]|uniref:putative Ig domain-containing protein n=1 Tax=Chitinivorax sp. B TaxID=2502235 RepID=UPI0010F97E36|nr:prenyltransferase/squalene oxidase repeat-containing protein [Chitinivorax sp. B]